MYAYTWDGSLTSSPSWVPLVILCSSSYNDWSYLSGNMSLSLPPFQIFWVTSLALLLTNRLGLPFLLDLVFLTIKKEAGWYFSIICLSVCNMLDSSVSVFSVLFMLWFNTNEPKKSDRDKRIHQQTTHDSSWSLAHAMSQYILQYQVHEYALKLL